MTKDEAIKVVIDVAMKRKPNPRTALQLAVEVIEGSVDAKPAAKKKASK